MKLFYMMLLLTGCSSKPAKEPDPGPSNCTVVKYVVQEKKYEMCVLACHAPAGERSYPVPPTVPCSRYGQTILRQ